MPSVAPAVVGPSTQRATRPTKKLPQYLIDESQGVERMNFDPVKHLNYQPPQNIISMKEIGLEGHGISPNAVSDPFPLFTQEAIKQMRAEIFSQSVLDNCQYMSSFCQNMIRGMGFERAPFTYSAWRHPETLRLVSEVAGIELVPAIDLDIANINVSIADEDGNEDKSFYVEQPEASFKWHHDSYPFVCVTMISDCTGMIGGETALKTPLGEHLKVRGPTQGTAVVMQGRYIEHQALKTVGGRERISMVTSFRPKSALIKDETVLTGIRPISNLDELYTQYAQYRLEVLEERIRDRLKTERRREIEKGSFNVTEAKQFLIEQKEFIESMIYEIQP